MTLLAAETETAEREREREGDTVSDATRWYLPLIKSFMLIFCNIVN